MAKFKNEAGEEVEAFTKEEIDAQIKTAAEAAAAKAVEDFKTANPPKTAEQIAADKKAADEKAAADNEPVAKLTKTVEDLQKTLRNRDVADFAKVYTKGDTAKKTEFSSMFDRMSGFDDTTPEGMAAHAEAAARAIGLDVAGVDISSITGTGGGRDIDANKGKPSTEADKVIQKALGISEEDVKKYGPAVEAATAEKK